jgi:glycine cleavage system aminomethyltransferase T
MSLAFLRVDSGDAVAHSPMEGPARAAGARFEVRDGWSLAVEFAGAPAGDAVGWADVSHLVKVELQGSADVIDELPFGTAVRRDGAWWCRLTPTRAVVIGARPDLTEADDLKLIDVTCNFAALTLVGSQARETFARFCALDLRPHVTPVGALRPGSIGRQPGLLIREDEDRYLFLFGWATGEYMWSVVADAAGHLGGAPIGVDALREVSAAHA